MAQLQSLLNLPRAWTGFTGDGATREGPQVRYEYAPGITGVLTICLSVTNDAGYSSTLCKRFCFCPTFRRGDANREGSVNSADAVYILQNLFVHGPPIACPDAADSNDDEGVDIADAVYILQRLFAAGPPIPQPHPECGIDETSHPTGRADLPSCDYCAEACKSPPVPCP